MVITLKNKTVKIRRARQCYSCLRKYPIGSRMNYWTGIIDGDFSASYTCITCTEIMQLDTENIFPVGYVKEMLLSDETPEELLKKLKTE